MLVRLGIELSPVACRLVELDVSRRSGRDRLDTRIRSFARLTREGVETHLRLPSLRGQPAAVVVWGLQADHRQAVVAHGSFRRMRRAAVSAIRNAGVETRGRVADISAAATRVKGEATQSVVVALARTHDLAAALRWLTDKGVKVESLVTPALALMSLARLRRGSAPPGSTGAIEVYVALEETMTAVTLVRYGALAAACELEWGYQDEQGATRTRAETASRLGDEIERFLAGNGVRPHVVSQICVCGGLPELRSMAVALMERLDVEVETLDSLFAIDAARLPEPAHEFRDHSAELRLAWAVAAEWPGQINLLRERERRVTKTVLSRAALVAGVATGVGVAWQIQRSDWWRSTAAEPGPASALAVSPPLPAPATIPAPGRRQPSPSSPLQPAATQMARQDTRPPAPVVTPPLSSPIVQAEQRQLPPQSPSTAVKVPVFEPPRLPMARAEQPPAIQQPVARPLAVRPAVEQPRVLPPPVGSPRQEAAERRTSRQGPETPPPFDAALGTILYAPERKLAIIDGRIVQVGDDVRGARIEDITPTGVLLRDGQGRLRRLALGASDR